MTPLLARVPPELSAADFRAIADLLQARTGIALSEGKRSLVLARLARRLRKLGLPDFAAYAALLGSEAGATECREMVSALTTNVTAFFREAHHFDTLRRRVLPPLIARARAGGRLRLWSAGCASGEEPYSIAMELLDLCPEAAGLDIRILASDVDPAILARARDGIYRAEALTGLSAARRRRWFRPLGDGTARAAPGLAAPIRFRELNLAGQWPLRGPFDAIFCRNVTIYLDRPAQDRIWQGFAGLLAPAGHLFIGHSERLTGPAAERFTSVGITTYRRRA
ncbi:CheR family methyltransferase [Frigidibacter sp. ROC022]|uniref:CheR family methyltransferase n=1 Tax=Frigidibacter sp. ROC022 TaxID=2971796 RepID=UPI00215B21BE|nr:protein-glutamate O-methyltransferase [Frigidibacter sp. ROC022]MCR8725043.1 protein-glutamate O-methyltransferase [Frigidibacter sp. ROC022]